MEFFHLVKETENKFSLIDTNSYIRNPPVSDYRKRVQRRLLLAEEFEYKVPCSLLPFSQPVEGLKTQLSFHSSLLENQSLQQCYKVMSRVTCICYVKGKLCCCSCASMADLAVWKIKKVLLKIPYAERIYTLERNPEYQKERRRMMAFIMNMWKGRIIRPGLDMLIFI